MRSRRLSAPVPVEVEVVSLLREDEGRPGDVRHAGLVVPPVAEEDGEAEEEDGEAAGGEEGGDCPGRQVLAVVQLRQLADVGAPQWERQVAGGPLVLQEGQQGDQPGEVTVTGQGVAWHWQPRHGGPGQAVRPHCGQGVVGEVHLQPRARGGEEGGQVTQLRVVADGDHLQPCEPLQAAGLHLYQLGAGGDVQWGQRAGQGEEMLPGQSCEILLTEADHFKPGQRSQIKGRGEKVVRDIEDLQHQRRGEDSLGTRGPRHRL